jgi:hypothetical protein
MTGACPHSGLAMYELTHRFCCLGCVLCFRGIHLHLREIIFLIPSKRHASQSFTVGLSHRKMMLGLHYHPIFHSILPPEWMTLQMNV